MNNQSFGSYGERLPPTRQRPTLWQLIYLAVLMGVAGWVIATLVGRCVQSYQDRSNWQIVQDTARQLARCPHRNVVDGDTLPTVQVDHWGRHMTAEYLINKRYRVVTVTSMHRNPDSSVDDIFEQSVNYELRNLAESAAEHVTRGAAKGTLEGVGAGLRNALQGTEEDDE